LLLAALVFVALAAGPAHNAGAQTAEIEGKRAEAREVQARMQATLEEVAGMQAAYDRSARKLKDVEREIRANERALGEKEEALEGARERLSERAASSYRSGGVVYLDVLLSVRSFEDLAGRGALLMEIMAEDRRVLRRADEAREELAEQRERLEDERDNRAGLLRDMREQQAAIDRRLEKQRDTYASLGSEIQALVREEQERRAREAAEARARAAAEARAREMAEQQAALEKVAAADAARQLQQRYEEQAAAEAAARAERQRLAEQAAKAERQAREAEARKDARQEQARLAAQAAEARRASEEQAAAEAAARAEQQRLVAEAKRQARQAERQAAARQAAQEAAAQKAERQAEQSAAQAQYEAPEPAAPVESVATEPATEPDTKPAPESTATAADPRAQAILDNPNISMYPGVEGDIASGNVDSRVLDVIEFAAQGHTITLSAIRTGHPYGDSPTLDTLGYSGYPNAHYFYRAVDIAEIDGAPVSAGNAAAQQLAQEIYNSFAPAELGSPWTFGAGSFSDALHQDHIHVGWPYGSEGAL
jgi:peptidoglycan hydrolase CwlO-like protein